MSENNVQLEVMKHVERAVRPVVAPHVRKMHMRRELLDHLSKLYEQETERLGDSRAAATRAIERFGDPRELTEELQAEVSRWDQWMFRINDWWRRRDGEPVLRHALRVSLGVTVSMGVYMFVTLSLIQLLIVPHNHPPIPPFSLWRFYAALVVASAIGGFAFALIGEGVLGILRNGLNGSRCVRLAGLAMLAGPLAFLIAGGVATTAAGHPAYMFREFPSLYALLIFAPAMLTGVAMGCEHERRRAAEWMELVIEGQ